MTQNRYYQGPRSDHFDGTRFFNPGQPRNDPGVGHMWRMMREGGRSSWPKSVPVVPAKPDARIDGMRITAVGHASLLIQVAGHNILTDPVWSDRASPFSFAGPKRVTDPGIAFGDLPPIDAVLLSHCHYDHLDTATLRRLQAEHAPLFAMPLGNDAIVRAAVPDARCVAGDWWDRLPLNDTLGTTLTPGNHSAGRWLSDQRMALWSGHWLHTPLGTVWFVGDTAYGDGAMFRDVRERLGSPDVALIPIGAYEPRWFMEPLHVNPSEAVRIFSDVVAGHALGIHWGTFQLTNEARDAPKRALVDALAAAHLASNRFVAAEPGFAYDLLTANPTQSGWKIITGLASNARVNAAAVPAAFVAPDEG